MLWRIAEGLRSGTGVGGTRVYTRVSLDGKLRIYLGVIYGFIKSNFNYYSTHLIKLMILCVVVSDIRCHHKLLTLTNLY